MTVRYAPIFEQRFKQSFPDIEATIVNGGVSGETSRDGLQRLPQMLAEKPNIVIICFGMNDRGAGKKAHKRVPQSEFVQNLTRIISAFEDIGARILLLTINPLAESSGSLGDRMIDAYNKAIHDGAYKTKVRLVDINAMWKREFKPFSKGLEDTLHPNKRGIELYSKALKLTVPRRNIIVLWQYNGNPCACNYKCPYCVYRHVQQGQHFQGTVEGWHHAFKKSFGNQHIAFYLAHGEPMIGENFYDVLEMVGNESNWEIRMTSNISISLNDLVKTRVAQEGRLNINASFHPYMVKREKFLDQALFLRKHGIEVPIIYVMYPPLLKRFEDDFKFFNAHNFLVHVRRFRGTHKGKVYPKAYTDEEQQFIAKYCDDATIKYMLFNEPSYGKQSWAGVDFVIVDNKGNVGYCDDFRPNKHALGNIFKGNFRRHTEPKPFPGRFTSDGTVDGVANFLELNYRQLTGNNVINFSRQGGVYHTPNGIYYKNMNVDFNDSRVRAEYHFPARNLKDAYAILTYKEDPFHRRIARLAQSAYPDIFYYNKVVTPKTVAVWIISRIIRFFRCTKIVQKIHRLYQFAHSYIPYFFLSEGGYLYAKINGLRGIQFYTFGQRCAFKFLHLEKLRSFLTLLLNPVPLFRFAEFDFVIRSAKWKGSIRVLDVSSPRLFSAYLLATNPDLQLYITNPDKSDITNTHAFLKTCNLDGERIEFQCLRVADLSYQNGFFDVIYAISVIEHVLEEEQNNFLAILWRFLKPGGKLILTVPVSSKYRIEYRKKDVYSLGYPRNENGAIFFQRVYDAASLKKQIIAPMKKLQGRPGPIEVFGLTAGWKFEEYLKRWENFGIAETAKDIYYASKYIHKFDRIAQLKERGVCGLTFTKP